MRCHDYLAFSTQQLQDRPVDKVIDLLCELAIERLALRLSTESTYLNRETTYNP